MNIFKIFLNFSSQALHSNRTKMLTVLWTYLVHYCPWVHMVFHSWNTPFSLPIYCRRPFKAQVPIFPSVLFWPSPFIRFLLPLDTLTLAEHIIDQQRTSVKSSHPPTHLPATVTVSSILSTVKWRNSACSYLRQLLGILLMLHNFSLQS